VVKARLVVVLALALGAAGAAFAADSREGHEERRGFEVVGHADPRDPYVADVWGHDGHAYLSSHKGRDSCPASGVRIYSLANPRTPRLVSRFAGGDATPELRRTWTEKTIVKRVATPAFTGALAVTSVQACRPGSGDFQGFALYDVTRPTRPRRLALVRTEPRGSHEIWLHAIGNRAYVYTAIIASEIRSSRNGRPGDADFRIYDVSNPTQPRQVGEWGAWRALGIPPFRDPNDRLNGNFVHSVITNAAGTRAFLSYWNLGTVILDIQDPANPRYLGRTDAAGAAGDSAHSAWLAPGERLLVETHERGGGVPLFFDVSNPRAPRVLSRFRLPERELVRGRRERLSPVSGLDLADSVHDAKVRGKVAFFSWYRQGVVAVDIGDARRPRFLARFLPPPARDREKLFCPGESCTAFWGVYATPSYVLASDMLGGLWVLRFR
jgi:hypothetical protein